MVRARNKKNPKPKMRERRSRKWSLKIKSLKKRKKPRHYYYYYYWIFKDDDIPEVGRSHTLYFQFQKTKSLMKLSDSPVDQCRITSEKIQIMTTERPDCDRSGKEEHCESSNAAGNGERERERERERENNESCKQFPLKKSFRAQRRQLRRSSNIIIYGNVPVG